MSWIKFQVLCCYIDIRACTYVYIDFNSYIKTERVLIMNDVFLIYPSLLERARLKYANVKFAQKRENIMLRRLMKMSRMLFETCNSMMLNSRVVTNKCAKAFVQVFVGTDHSSNRKHKIFYGIAWLHKTTRSYEYRFAVFESTKNIFYIILRTFNT